MHLDYITRHLAPPTRSNYQVILSIKVRRDDKNHLVGLAKKKDKLREPETVIRGGYKQF